MDKPVLNATVLGILAGMTTTLFESLFMLTDNLSVPPSFPVALAALNLFFWMTFGFLSGSTMKLFERACPKFFANRELFSRVLFFLVPFAVVYGLLGRLDLTNLFSPGYDRYLAFVWVGLILLLLCAFQKKVSVWKPLPVSFLPEIAVTVMLFLFCSNVASIKLISNSFNDLFAASGQNYTLYAAMQQKFLAAVYILGVLVIILLYLALFCSMRLVRKKQSLVVAGLFFLAIGSLATCFSIAQGRFHRNSTPGAASRSINTLPNPPCPVILIVLDTVRADRLSLYGGPCNTKNVDAFARESMVYQQCFAPSPWTLPSHASLFTGSYPREHGSHFNIHKPRWFDGFPPIRPVPDNFTTLAETFKGNGYTTVGIVSNYGVLRPANGFSRGFDVYDWSKSIGAIYHYPFRPMLPLFSFLTNIRPQFNLFYRTAEEMNRAVFRAVDALWGKPFFLFINYLDAHTPYCPPRPFSTSYTDRTWPQLYKIDQQIRAFRGSQDNTFKSDFELSQYNGEIDYLDRQLGNLFEHLKASGLYKQSLIVITSDHGEQFGEHAFFGHKGFPMYEEVLHVPLIIKFPFSTRTGHSHERISLSDLYVSILTISGLPIPSSVSVSPSRGTPLPMVSEHYTYSLGAHRVLYDGSYKLMAFGGDKTPELYNLSTDPHERTSLTTIRPEIVSKMLQTLKRWEETYPARYNTTAAGEDGVIAGKIKEGLKALGYIQ